MSSTSWVYMPESNSWFRSERGSYGYMCFRAMAARVRWVRHVYYLTELVKNPVFDRVMAQG
jgi:hypothetical protein